MWWLESIDLGGKNIRAAGAASLAPSLAPMAQLTELDLSSNSLGDVGAASLAPSLARMALLMSLDLRINLISAAARGAALLPRFARIGRRSQWPPSLRGKQPDSELSPNPHWLASARGPSREFEGISSRRPGDPLKLARLVSKGCRGRWYSLPLSLPVAGCGGHWHSHGDLRVGLTGRLPLVT
jgi:hypothetical protein